MINLWGNSAMWPVEINGNLSGPTGLKNYRVFEKTILEVYSYFFSHLSHKFPNGVELYIDNATCDSGYTPIATPVFKKYIIIKLCVSPEDPPFRIAFQFSHELMHYVFYIKYGLEKKRADNNEEAICTAASLIYLYDTNRAGFDIHNNYVKNLGNEGYRNGAALAEEVNYSFNKLIERI